MTDGKNYAYTEEDIECDWKYRTKLRRQYKKHFFVHARARTTEIIRFNVHTAQTLMWARYGGAMIHYFSLKELPFYDPCDDGPKCTCKRACDNNTWISPRYHRISSSYIYDVIYYKDVYTHSLNMNIRI